MPLIDCYYNSYNVAYLHQVPLLHNINHSAQTLLKQMYIYVFFFNFKFFLIYKTMCEVPEKLLRSWTSEV